MKVVVLADTHTRGPSRPLPKGAWPYLESADHILHAGDVTDPALLDQLEACAPLTVVLGNCDGLDVKQRGARQRCEIELGGIRVAMVHDSGPAAGRRARLRSWFPTARVAVFGHSHLPLVEDDGELLLLNPGSPTWPRRAPWPSLGMLWIDPASASVEAEVFPV